MEAVKKLDWGTKAETLERLKDRLQSAKILPQIRFSCEDWQQNQQSILALLENMDWLSQTLIVRSSSSQEDSSTESLAGHFTSILNVLGTSQLRDAVAQVIHSFGSNGLSEQIFIQPMLTEIDVSGVAFSHEPNTGSPYFVINYDDQSGRTDSVTSGSTSQLRTYYHYRYAPFSPPEPWLETIQLVFELEELLPETPLDLEFAIDKSGQLWLLQVRPLIIQDLCSSEQEKVLTVRLQAIERRFSTLNRPHPYLHGQHTLFGVMPDWNPAEIIGIRPGQLARTLYQDLITDSIWAYQRHNYGYRNLRSFPLLQNFGGCSYIDVRLSFNSFLPAELPSELAERLAQYYLDRLNSYPNYHDKVEFEILFSCYTLDLPERLQVLKKHDFNDTETILLADSLRRLTHKIIHPETGLWKQDIERIQRLEELQELLEQAKLDPIAHIYWLLEDCKRYGTLPFAGLARAGFIAVQMLRSMVSTKIISAQEYAQFMAQLDTISTSMGKDFSSLNRTDFLKKYGHLRPGTYDLNSPRYDEEPDRYFDWDRQMIENDLESQPFMLSLPQFKAIEDSLHTHQLDFSVLGLFDFIKQAIEGREYAKFVFTRSLSRALQLIGQVAQGYGLKLDEAAHIDIACIHQLYTSSQDVETVLRQSIAQGLLQTKLTKRLVLPPLISKAKDIWSFGLEQGEPNFITLNRASGKVSTLQSTHLELEGSILFIESADPGYDWVFSHHIAGFITMYGGANSHMAIRAGELEIPAVIGSGEILYRRWSQGRLLELDCLNRQVNILK